MVSWYSHSPSDFFVEYGWAGRVIDPATWQPHETFNGPSFWGHERLYKMPPEQRAPVCGKCASLPLQRVCVHR
jgi:hypothetical protein